MKKIYFVRHAKSSWETNGDDHARPLSTRGFNDADIIGKHLNKQAFSIDGVYSSTANRAETTARIVCENLNIPLPNIQLSKDLYDFEGQQVMRFIKNEVPKEQNEILIFGHNSCFNTLVNTLGSEVFFSLPTCTAVGIAFNVDNWKDVKEGETFFSVKPKEIR